MDDWRVNDASSHWTRPSIDFLFLDRDGCLVAAELKRRIVRPREAWLVLCQVTHRAHHLAATCNAATLERIYRDCHGGTFGRVVRGDPEPLAQAHQRFFRCDVSVGEAGAARRLVLAVEFGPSWSSICARFNGASVGDVGVYLQAHYAVTARGNREMARFLGLRDEPPLTRGPVEYCEV